VATRTATGKAVNALLVPRPPRIRTPLGFGIVALLFYLIDGAIVHSAAFAARPEPIATAVSFDLTLGVTLAYWMMVVRPGHAALRTALPVFVAAVAAAALTLPPGHRDLVQYIRYLGIPLELVAVWLVVAGVRRTHRALSASGIAMDVPERIRMALSGSPLPSRAADVVTMEMSLLYYALASWRRRPFSIPAAQAFSYHRRSSFAAILYTACLASIVETIAVHFLLRATFPRVAVGVLALSIFGTFWVLGFARSIQLRPILVTDTDLLIRVGLQWSLDVPRASIAKIEAGRVKAPAKGTPGFLRVTIGQPNVLIELREPMRARGAYGAERQVSVIAFTIDDPAGFRAALESAAAPH
jgi:hypothetical protein